MNADYQTVLNADPFIGNRPYFLFPSVFARRVERHIIADAGARESEPRIVLIKAAAIINAICAKAVQQVRAAVSIVIEQAVAKRTAVQWIPRRNSEIVRYKLLQRSRRMTLIGLILLDRDHRPRRRAVDGQQVGLIDKPLERRSEVRQNRVPPVMDRLEDIR